MTEIPRDGKTYLAWHETEGHILAYWGFTCYRHMHDCNALDMCQVKRWMDEKGQWREVSDE